MNRSPRPAAACWLGRVPYQEAWDLQRRLAAEIAAGQRPDTILLLEHPHVFTMGRRATLGHVLWDEAERARRGVELVWCDRGGDVTYHGPGQLVGYPLLNLGPLGDVVGHLRRLEEALIGYLGTLGLAAERVPEYTGVWARGAKVAAIGVRLSAHVVTHGFALNLTTDLDYFGGIVPCGIEDREVTSVERLSGSAPAPSEAAAAVARWLAQACGLDLAWTPSAPDLIAAG